MDTTGYLVILGNMLGALSAVVAHLALCLIGPAEFRRMAAATAALSIVYALGYVWLASHPDRVAEWSYLFRGLSLFAWPLAWTAPAVMLVRWAHRLGSLRRHLDAELERLRTEALSRESAAA